MFILYLEEKATLPIKRIDNFGICRTECLVEGGSNQVLPVIEGKPDLGERFEILSFLGRGSVGLVYKVRDRQSDAIFAVKVLSQDLSIDSATVKRFRNEVLHTSKLNHPSIVPVYGCEETTSGTPYLVMDYAPGGTLADLLANNGSLDESSALPIFQDIADALAHAHALGIVHRDLKPSNVIVNHSTKRITARIVDFGLAKAKPAISDCRETQDLTETGEVFGTPAYMSPEQCLGFRHDERSDIYSFGCLMYEVITGKPPFSGNPMQIVIQHLNEYPAGWHKHSSCKLLNGIEAIVFRCLEKEPDDRYQSAELLLADLRNIVQSGSKSIKHVRIKKTEPMTKGVTPIQALMQLFECALLLLYWVAITSTISVAVLPTILAPLAVFRVIKHFRTYKLAGSNWKQWQFLSKCVWSLLCLSGIPLYVTWIVGASDELPTVFYYLVAGVFIFHLSSVIGAFASKLAAFFCTTTKKVSFRRVCVQSALIFAPLLLLASGTLKYRINHPSLTNLPDIVLALSSSLNAEHITGMSTTFSRVAILLNDRFIPAYQQLADRLIEQNNPAEAISVLDVALHKVPQYHMQDSTELFFLLSRSFHPALNIVGQERKSLLQTRAVACHLIGRHAEAVSNVSEALSLIGSEDRSEQELLLLRGSIYSAMDARTKALNDFKRASRIEISNELKVCALWRVGDKRGAIKSLTKEIDSDERVAYSSSPSSYVERGLLLRLSGDVSKGNKDLRRAIAILKSWEPVLNRDGTRTILSSLLEPQSGSYKIMFGDIHLLRAYAHTLLGESSEAKKAIKQAQEIGWTKADLRKVNIGRDQQVDFFSSIGNFRRFCQFSGISIDDRW